MCFIVFAKHVWRKYVVRFDARAVGCIVQTFFKAVYDIFSVMGMLSSFNMDFIAGVYLCHEV